MLGYTAAEVVGSLLSDTIVPPKYRLQHGRGLAEFRRSGVATALGHRLQVTALCKDGEEIPVHLTISRLPGDPPQFLGVIALREELSYFEVMQQGQSPPPPPTPPRPPTAAEWRSRDDPQSTPFSRAEFDGLRDRVTALEEERAQEAAAYGTTTLGPLEKAVIPELIRWYIQLKERVGTSTKTGVDLIRELITTRAERIHLNRATVVILGAVTPFLVALFAAILTIVAARIAPTIPTPPPPVPLTSPTPAPEHQPPIPPTSAGRP